MTIVGGLCLSQLLTLYTTPVVFLYMDAARRRVRRRIWQWRYGKARARRLEAFVRKG